MSISFKELEFFVLTHDFSDKYLQLDACSLITDRRKFAESHIRLLKANSGNKCYLPYFKRLLNFYKIIKMRTYKERLIEMNSNMPIGELNNLEAPYNETEVFLCNVCEAPMEFNSGVCSNACFEADNR